MQPEILEVLLEATKQRFSENGWKHLHATIYKACVTAGATAAVDLLLKAGVDPNFEPYHDGRLLHIAVRHGPFETVELLLKSGADPTSPGGVDKESPLHYAARSALSRNSVNALLKAGANPDDLDGSGRSPLMVAAMYYNVDAVDSLLNGGASPNLAPLGNGQQTALHYASRILGIMSSNIIASLLRSGADIHARDNLGRTPLHLAATYYNIVAIKALLDRGASVVAVDNNDKTPCDIIYYGEIAMLLYSHWFTLRYRVWMAVEEPLAHVRERYMLWKLTARREGGFILV